MKTPSCTLIAPVSRAILLPGILRSSQHRRKVIALIVFATLRVASCQTSGIRATFTGTQPTTPVQEGWATPKDTKGSSSQPVILFGSVDLAVASPPQLTATFTVTGFSGTFTPTAMTHYGLDYTVGTVSCSGAAPSEICTVPITFNPTLPGGRKDALFLMNGTTRLATVLIGGVGLAPMALTQPGVVSTLYQLPDSHYFYASTVDENGNLYVIQGTSVVSITKAGVLTTLPLTGVSSFTGLAIDGAGVLYIGRSVGALALTTYDTVQGIQGSLAIPAATNAPVAVAVDVAGDVFALDEFGPALYTVKPDGTIISAAINPIFTQPSQLAADASGDVFIGGYEINELPAGGTQKNINTVGATAGLAVDAAGTLYATRYFAVNGVAELAATDYTTPIGALDSGSPLGLGLASDGTLFVSNYNVIDRVDRGAGVLNFGAQFIGNTFQTATTTIYNGGNQPLLFSSVALTGQGFTFVTQPGTNCATGTSVPPGGVCSLGVAFSAAHPGAFTGSLTVTTNSLNKVATTQTTTLTATQYGPYLNPTVSPLNFPNQIVNTASIPVVETIANQGDSFAGTLQNVTSSDPAFTIDRSTCPNAVAAGSTCPISITFTPTAVQSYTATITLSYYNSANGAILTNTFTVNGTGIPAPVPQVVLTPTMLAFPNQIVGTTTGSQNITVSNPGNGTLNISGITITGTGASSFAQSTTCGSTLAAGASCAITITFTPVGVASYSATVNVADNASGSPQTVALTGTGIPAPAPVVTLAPASLIFPDTVKSVTSAAQNMTLSNSGNATLNISSITLTGSNPTAFTIGGTCGATLAAGASCNITVTFTPPGIAGYSATVSVTDNATGSPHTATLTGTGIAAPAPVIALAPTSLTFPNTIVGVTSASQTITLTNSGNAALSIIGITLAGANPTSFTTGGSCGASVAAGTSCNITVSFTPASAAMLSATVTVTDNATGSPHQATVTGMGVAPPTPQAVLSPTSLTFASTTVGSTSAAQSITLSNPGTGPLSITGISIGGTNASSFASTNNCGATLAAAATCSISVTFSPSAAGSLSATITVADNAAGSPHTATLAGTGAALDFALTVSASSQTVSSYGGSAQYTFSAAGTNGSYNSPIAFSVTGLPTGVTAVLAPQSITPGTTSATTTLTVTVSSLGASLSGPGVLHNQGRSPVPPMTLAGAFCLLLSKRRRALLGRARLWLMVACMLGLGGVIGCGGGFRSANSVAPGTYTLNVAGTSSTGQHSTNITLIIQ